MFYHLLWCLGLHTCVNLASSSRIEATACILLPHLPGASTANAPSGWLAWSSHAALPAILGRLAAPHHLQEHIWGSPLEPQCSAIPPSSFGAVLSVLSGELTPYADAEFDVSPMENGPVCAGGGGRTGTRPSTACTRSCGTATATPSTTCPPRSGARPTQCPPTSD